MIVEYCDKIIKTGEPPSIEFDIYDKTFIGSSLKVIFGGKTIYTNKVAAKDILIKVEDCEESLSSYQVELQKDGRGYSFPYDIMRLNADEPYIICDIDFTISATNPFLYLTNNILHIKTLKDSADVLHELAERYKIIYLTGRDITHTRVTKFWLERRGFPRGPLLARRNESSLQIESFKKNALKNVVNISKRGIGIGDLKSDITAYLSHNLTAIKINRLPFFNYNSGRYRYKRGYYKVTSWKGIRNLFLDRL